MANEYVSLEDFKDERRITGTADDARIQRILTRASRAIDDKCSRFFYRTDLMEKLISIQGRTAYAGGSERLFPGDIATSTGLIVERGYSGSYSPVSSYSVTPPALPGWPIDSLTLASWYSAGSGLRITASWGWPAVPEPVKEACFLLANRRFTRRSSPEGISGWADAGAIQVSRFDPDIEDLISPYVLVGFGA